jgi:hypothetical protein
MWQVNEVNERKWTHEAKHGENYLVPLLNQSLCERADDK